MKNVIHGVLGIGMALGIWHTHAEHQGRPGVFAMTGDAFMPFCLMRISSSDLSPVCRPMAGGAGKGPATGRIVTDFGFPLPSIDSEETRA
jgi:hypothetical protein